MPTYRIHEGSLQARFLASKAKIQFFGGGFANGKTAAACVKAIQIAKDYPGANILMARSTYPKLNDTLRKELFKWLPAHWKKSFSKSDNTLVLTNGTTINFRYIAQQGKSGESTTSNLLSATYDLIIVDQIEDPEITRKDFDDLLGRLRGMTRYSGMDASMPQTGPRWLIITSNPSRNWVYTTLIRPYHRYQAGIYDPELLIDVDTKIPLLDVFEGSTYENAENLEADFIKALEATYRGQMRERFLMGGWGAYEGLVYPQFNDTVHVIKHEQMLEQLSTVSVSVRSMQWLEGYDYGMAVPACYICGFADWRGNIFILDGYYDKELTIEQMANKIKDMRLCYGIPQNTKLYADPSIFRRTAGGQKTVGKSIADMFREEGLAMWRGNNDIQNGIAKIQSYLAAQEMHMHPIYDEAPAPLLYVSSKCEWLINEFNDYHWKKDTNGQATDKPTDRNDHALDALKYMLSERPRVSVLIRHNPVEVPKYLTWGEQEQLGHNPRAHRYGNG